MNRKSHRTFVIIIAKEIGGICHGEEKTIRVFVARYPWTFAKTYADFAPHEYYVKDKLDEQGKKRLCLVCGIYHTIKDGSMFYSTFD